MSKYSVAFSENVYLCGDKEEVVEADYFADDIGYTQEDREAIQALGISGTYTSEYGQLITRMS